MKFINKKILIFFFSVLGINLLFFIPQEWSYQKENETIKKDLLKLNQDKLIIDELVKTINNQSQILEADSKYMEKIKYSNLSKYNNMVKSYNLTLSLYEANLKKYNNLISDYNKEVERLNELIKKTETRYFLMPIKI